MKELDLRGVIVRPVVVMAVVEIITEIVREIAAIMAGIVKAAGMEIVEVLERIVTVAVDLAALAAMGAVEAAMRAAAMGTVDPMEPVVMAIGGPVMATRTVMAIGEAAIVAVVTGIEEQEVRVATAIGEAAMAAIAMATVGQVLRAVTVEERREDLVAVREQHVPDSGIPDPRVLILRSRQNPPAIVRITIITRMIVMTKRM